jgi:hypothetical protein
MQPVIHNIHNPRSKIVSSDVKIMKKVLGKTIKGIIVKENTGGSKPRMTLHLVFTDDTSYEIYSDESLSFAAGLDGGGMVAARKYMIGKNQPFVNILDVSIDDR